MNTLEPLYSLVLEAAQRIRLEPSAGGEHDGGAAGARHPTGPGWENLGPQEQSSCDIRASLQSSWAVELDTLILAYKRTRSML